MLALVKSKSTRVSGSFAAAVEQLEIELVNAVLDALRAGATAALDNVLSQSASQIASVRPSRGKFAPAGKDEDRPSRTRAKPGRRKRAAAASAGQAEASTSTPQELAPLTKEEAQFTITDPSVVLAEVAEAPPPEPRFVRLRPRTERKRRAERVVAPPPEPEPAEPAEPTPPVLREGEQVARAVVGGGVVLRRSRT